MFIEMENTRDNVSIEDFNSLSKLEQKILGFIHKKNVDNNEPISFECIIYSFKNKYSFEKITLVLNDLRSKGFLKQHSFYSTTFRCFDEEKNYQELEENNEANL